MNKDFYPQRLFIFLPQYADVQEISSAYVSKLIRMQHSKFFISQQALEPPKKTRSKYKITKHSQMHCHNLDLLSEG